MRAEGADLFGYGAREAVVRAVLGQPADQAPFGTAVPAEDLAAVLRLVPGTEVVLGDDGVDEVDVVDVRSDRPDAVAALAFAHGWRLESPAPDAGSAVMARLRPATT